MCKGFKAFTTEYDLYLQDESRKKGYAETVSFPASSEEVSRIVKQCAETGTAVTVRGSGTGVGGGAVPFGGHLMSLEKIRHLRMGTDGRSVIAGAGRSLNEINDFINRETGGKLFFPPDPTEGTASAGGMVSCNSSGARTYRYGPVRNYVKRIKAVLADGEIIEIERNRIFASGRNICIDINKEGDPVAVTGAEKEPPACNTTEEKRIIKLPGYEMPDVKNAAGYYVRDDMDLIDLFIGAEGTLGIITEAEFLLEEKPRYIWGVISFFEKEDMGIEFSQMLKSKKKECRGIISVEFFDSGSLKILRDRKKESQKEMSSPVIPERFREAVFTEIAADSLEEMGKAVKLIEICIEKAGGNPDDAWAAGSPRSFETFKQLRHATPEGVNERIAAVKKLHPLITKLGSDMSVPEECFRETVQMYRTDLINAGLNYVMFGHIGNSHLHVNIISGNEEEYSEGKSIFMKWAENIGRMRGSISAEHGVGKLKRDFLICMYGQKSVDEMRELKKAFDPEGILGRDNIFVWNKQKK
ncbi:MAG: FAD-binding oxidoreductase [Bacillota bacterium]|nr:FAD-binding oxidoreductase [Bacillota bacterium]